MNHVRGWSQRLSGAAVVMLSATVRSIILSRQSECDQSLVPGQLQEQSHGQGVPLLLTSDVPCIDDFIIRSSSWGDPAQGVQWQVKYDTRSRTPKWAYEKFTRADREMLARPMSRKGAGFYEEKRLEFEAFRIKPSDFSF